jgi:hypothetical protein
MRRDPIANYGVLPYTKETLAAVYREPIRTGVHSGAVTINLLSSASSLEHHADAPRTGAPWDRG